MNYKLKILLTLLMFPLSLFSKVFITPDEAIKEAFKNATIEKKRIYLTENDVKSMEQELGFKIKHQFYSFYVAKENNKTLGYAILHTDVVRTREMSVMVVLDPEIKIKNLYLISFYEPLEYKPSDRWLGLFINKSKEDALTPGIDIPIVSGATLTSRTVSEMVRLTLKLSKFLEVK
jgi:hypothetical protein